MTDRPTKRLFGRPFEHRLIPIVVLLIGLLAVPMPSYARDAGTPARPAPGGGSPVVDPHAGHRAAVAPTGGPPMPGPMAMSEPPGESYVKRELVLPTTGWIATASAHTAPIATARGRTAASPAR